MAPRSTDSDRAPTRATDTRSGDGTRRAPFSANPTVGARGQRTRQRILDAALRVFADDGYHQTGVDRITAVAGCSRASFYQYFSGKEDVFRQLAGQIARQLGAAIEALGPLTPDGDGWTAIRGWVARYADVHRRYAPVFQVFQTATDSDEAVTGGAAQVGERNVAALHARLATTLLPPRRLDPVIGLLLECVPRTFGDAAIVRLAEPAAYLDDRLGDALADVVHRSLFGLQPGVNARPAAGPRPPRLDFGPVMRAAIERPPETLGVNAAGRRTVEILLAAGRDLFVARGYHRTRINDLVAAADLSHGAFYRYFASKEEFAHVLAVRAFRQVSAALDEIPEAAVVLDVPAGRTALRRWLRRYNATQAAEAAMIRVWVDAALQDGALRGDSAATLDWGRRRLVRFLTGRDAGAVGDVEIEAIVMVALLAAFGSRPRSPAEIDAAVHIVERGFLAH